MSEVNSVETAFSDESLAIAEFDVTYLGETFTLEVTAVLMRDDRTGYNVMLSREGLPYGTIGKPFVGNYIGGLNNTPLWKSERNPNVDASDVAVIEGRRLANVIVSAFKKAMLHNTDGIKTCVLAMEKNARRVARYGEFDHQEA